MDMIDEDFQPALRCVSSKKTPLILNQHIMTKSQKFDNRLAEFKFTKSPANGRFNMVNPRCSYQNYLNGKPEDIALHFAEILDVTLKGMEENGARNITMVCRWE
jgi:hypothetical protein